MRPVVYLVLFLLLIPFQATLLGPLSIAGIKPDISLALLYILGLLVGPCEAVIAGVCVGLLLDIGSAGIVGLMGITRGMVGLAASLLGRRVLDLTSPSNGLFLAAFSLTEGICLALFMQLLYGSVPFFRLLGTSILPQAIYTGVLGIALLLLLSNRKIPALLRKQTLHKEF